MITRKDLEQIIYINREVELWKTQLDSLHKADDPEDEAAGIEKEIEKIVQNLLYKVQEKQREINTFLESITDPLLKEIIFHRCFMLCTWETTADYIGNENTADGLRQIYRRAIPVKG